jgi:hypothetical protein
MKFKNIIRVQLMLVGLGAGLLVAKPALAQQDSDPTLFESPYAASSTDQEGLNTAALPAAAMSAPAVTTAASPVLEADTAEFTAIDTDTNLVFMAGMGLFVLLAMALTSRGNRGRAWKKQPSRILSSTATAN